MYNTFSDMLLFTIFIGLFLSFIHPTCIHNHFGKVMVIALVFIAGVYEQVSKSNPCYVHSNNESQCTSDSFK